MLLFNGMQDIEGPYFLWQNKRQNKKYLKKIIIKLSLLILMIIIKLLLLVSLLERNILNVEPIKVYLERTLRVSKSIKYPIRWTTDREVIAKFFYKSPLIGCIMYLSIYFMHIWKKICYFNVQFHTHNKINFKKRKLFL